MSEPFLGEVRMAGFNFAPRGWLLCNGQLVAIQQYAALFSLLGTTYGGDGVQTFALPNFQSRTPIGMGTGPGLSPVVLGEIGGEENHRLLLQEIPSHTHIPQAASDAPNATTPVGNTWAAGNQLYHTVATQGATMHANAIGAAGGGQGHPNIQPYLVVNFIIATVGIYPSRN